MKNFPIHSRKRDPNVDWHRWFAWYPVDVRFERRWLTYVERKWHTNDKGHANGDIEQLQRRLCHLEATGQSSQSGPRCLSLRGNRAALMTGSPSNLALVRIASSLRRNRALRRVKLTFSWTATIKAASSSTVHELFLTGILDFTLHSRPWVAPPGA